jgi:hypothetical protein
LLFSLFKLWILLVWKTEKHFSTVVRVELSVSDEILFLEHLKSIKSNLWFNSWDTWTVFNEVSSECGDIVNKEVNFLDQIFLELGLLSEETILDISGLFDKGTPIFFDDCRSIHLISFLFFVLHVGAILQESEHINDGSEVDIDFRFLLSDFLKSVHNLTQGIDVLGWFIDFESNLLHVIIEGLKHSVSSDVEIVGVSILP